MDEKFEEILAKCLLVLLDAVNTAEKLKEKENLQRSLKNEIKKL